jgi:ATP-dependent DNA ligase
VSGLKTAFVEVLEHRICESGEDLMKEMAKITGSGGEGVMLRHPDSVYEEKRSK